MVISLVPATVDFAEVVVGWFAYAEVNELLPFEPLRLTLDEETAYLADNFKLDYQLFVGVLDGSAIGLCGLHTISNVSARTVTIVDPGLHGRGLATNMRTRIVHYAFEVLGMDVLRASVLGCNRRAARLMASTGGVYVGLESRRVQGKDHVIINFEQGRSTPKARDNLPEAIRCPCGR